jgi:hypothetical protein
MLVDDTFPALQRAIGLGSGRFKGQFLPKLVARAQTVEELI